MGLEKVDPGMVAPEQQVEASTSPTSRAPSVRRKSSSLSSESVNTSELDFKETMDAPTKAPMELEETGRERLTIQCGMARLAILEDFVMDLGPALRACRPVLAIEEHLESMERRISVMEQAVSAPLPTSSSPANPAAPAQDHTLSQAPQSFQGEAPISVAAPSPPWRCHQLKGSPNGRRKLNNGWRLPVHQRHYGNRGHQQRGRAHHADVAEEDVERANK